MDFNIVYKNIVDEYPSPIMVVDLKHNIRYMNKNAIKRYAHRGGANLIGQSLFACHNEHSKKLVLKAIEKLQNDHDLTIGYEYYNKKHNENLYIIAIRDENKKLIGYYERHEEVDNV